MLSCSTVAACSLNYPLTEYLSAKISPSPDDPDIWLGQVEHKSKWIEFAAAAIQEANSIPLFSQARQEFAEVDPRRFAADVW